VGERAAPIRAGAARLAYLGVAIDEQRNRDAHGNVEIGTNDSSVRTFVLSAREDFETALQARALLTS
jgi:acetate kinase